jgi:hypothetical protein
VTLRVLPVPQEVGIRNTETFFITRSTGKPCISGQSVNTDSSGGSRVCYSINLHEGFSSVAACSQLACYRLGSIQC